MKRPPPLPPYPSLRRRPGGGFGWLESRLLHEGTLAELGPEAVSVLVLLSLAANPQGASWYGRERMAALLGMSREKVDGALEKLLKKKLVAFRPWKRDPLNGVWQLLPLPPSPGRKTYVLPIQEILRSLGLQPQPRQ